MGTTLEHSCIKLGKDSSCLPDLFNRIERLRSKRSYAKGT